MPASAADRKSIRRLEKQAEVDAASRAGVIRNLMSTVDGRAWMWHQLSTAHIFASTFTPDPLITAFNEGQRAIGLAMLADILSTCPDQYIQAQREANVRSTTDERRSGPIDDRGDSGSDDLEADAYRDPNSDADHAQRAAEAEWPGLISDADRTEALYRA
jgi:hypothetical protein